MINNIDELNGSDILVTGGLGFVGSNLVKFLVKNFSCKVTVVDNCINSSESEIEEVRDQVNFIKLSVLDEEFYTMLDKFDYVFHLACIQIAASSKDPLLDVNVNSLSTLRILEFYRSNKTKLKRFIYTSSGSVYGSSNVLPLQEDGKIKPLSIYAASKFLGEQYTLIYGRNYNIPVSSVRYSNVYGYGQSPNNPYCGVLGKFIHNAIYDMPLTIIGDGEQTRDYTFILDAVKATLICATSPSTLGNVFNIGTGVETSVNKLAEIIGRIKSIQVLNAPERDIDNIRRRALDIEKLHLATGWVPETNIEKGILDTFKWYESKANV
jgi:UDP-glucose 4-epimerase